MRVLINNVSTHIEHEHIIKYMLYQHNNAMSNHLFGSTAK